MIIEVLNIHSNATDGIVLLHAQRWVMKLLTFIINTLVKLNLKATT